MRSVLLFRCTRIDSPHYYRERNTAQERLYNYYAQVPSRNPSLTVKSHLQLSALRTHRPVVQVPIHRHNSGFLRVGSSKGGPSAVFFFLLSHPPFPQATFYVSTLGRASSSLVLDSFLERASSRARRDRRSKILAKTVFSRCDGSFVRRRKRKGGRGGGKKQKTKQQKRQHRLEIHAAFDVACNDFSLEGTGRRGKDERRSHSSLECHLNARSNQRRGTRTWAGENRWKNGNRGKRTCYRIGRFYAGRCRKPYLFSKRLRDWHYYNVQR